MEVVGRDGVVKIGRARNPEKRLMNLQTGSYDSLRLHHAEPVDRSISPKVEARARRDLENTPSATGERRNRTREMLNRTTPEEGKEAILNAHNIIKKRNSLSDSAVQGKLSI
jgi:hypothetical protein